MPALPPLPARSAHRTSRTAAAAAHAGAHPPLRALGQALAAAGLSLAWGLAAAQQASAPAAVTPAAPAGAASAPAPARPAPRTAPGAAPQRVEITGNQSPDAAQEERRRSTAGRIVIGREELDRMGDSSVADVLKRLPGVTMGGPPGRGGGPRMRGMGGGYTLVMIDGQRMPPGFSLDDIPPEQIERIEIMRAPVAEFSTRAIAGAINVVMRGDFKRKANELRAGLQSEGGRVGGGANWQRNGQSDTLGWNTSLAVQHGGRDDASDTRTTGGLDDDGVPVSDETASNRSSGTRSAVFANGRLQFKLGGGDTLDLTPFFNVVRFESSGSTQRSAATPAAQARLSYTQATRESRSDSAMGRLNGTWNTTTGNGAKLQLQFSANLAQNESESSSLETGGSAGGTGRRRDSNSRSREAGLENKGKYALLLADRHSLAAGWELQHSQREDWQRRQVNGITDTSPFGEDVDATVQRLALFAQDEWAWSKQLSFYLGARYETIDTRADTLLGTTRSRSGVLTPLAHMVWKLDEKSRDQIRASLTRSYRSPNTNQLIGSLSKTTQYRDDETNTPLSPDRIGNPGLKPELAWGLELGYENYLEGGIFSANAFYRRIDNLIRNRVTGPQVVSWSPALRYVARPENVGTADTAGIELELKGRASDLWDTELPLSLRANTTLMWSRVSGVKGPDNRIEGQAPWTMNLGGDLPITGTPLTVSASWNYTPAFRVQQIDALTVRQSARSALDFNVLWRVAPGANVRFMVNNALAQRFDTGSTRLNDDGTLYQDSETRTRSYAQVGVRAEVKF